MLLKLAANLPQCKCSRRDAWKFKTVIAFLVNDALKSVCAYTKLSLSWYWYCT